MDDDDYVFVDDPDIELGNEFLPIDDDEVQDLIADDGEDDNPPELIEEEEDSDDDDTVYVPDGDDDNEDADDDWQDVPALPALPAREQRRLAVDMHNAPVVLEARTRSGMSNGTIGTVAPRDHHATLPELESIAMTQVSMKKGIELFGEQGVDAVRKELFQLYDMKTIQPVYKSSLTRDQLKASLAYLMFLKKK